MKVHSEAVKDVRSWVGGVVEERMQRYRRQLIKAWLGENNWCVRELISKKLEVG